MSEQTSGTAVVQKLNYSHEAMIDLLVAEPMISQRELAARFGYTEGWVSRVIRSDAFREMVARRKKELTDPLILQTLEERFESLAVQAHEVLSQALDDKRSPEVALKVLEISSRALGYGATKGGVQVQNNFVVAMPQKAENATDWLSAHAPKPIPAD